MWFQNATARGDTGERKWRGEKEEKKKKRMERERETETEASEGFCGGHSSCSVKCLFAVEEKYLLVE